MSLKTAFTTRTDPADAAQDLQKQLSGMDVTFLLFFASSAYDPASLSRALGAVFPGPSLGCTTAGEIVSGRMLKKSIVAMAFDGETLESAFVEGVPDLSPDGVKAGVRALEKRAGRPLADLDYKAHVGLIVIDGLSGAEERVMETLGDLSDIPFIGGAAGDDLAFKATHVFVNGRAMTKAAGLAVLKPRKGYDILKTQSFKVLDKRLTATKVDEATRTVLEFNGKPAAAEYAKALGVPETEAPKHFMHNPVGLMVGGEPYVRSPMQVKDGRMVFYCRIKNGMELSLLETGDIVSDTAKALETKRKEMGSVSGVVNFNCILRTLELEGKKQTEAYGKVFASLPTVGFSTYGEESLGHVNQTSTMVLFK
jgi:hypothetical protein